MSKITIILKKLAITLIEVCAVLFSPDLLHYSSDRTGYTSGTAEVYFSDETKSAYHSLHGPLLSVLDLLPSIFSNLSLCILCLHHHGLFLSFIQ